MKLKPDTVMLINFLFRIFLIIYLLKEDEQEKSKGKRPLRYWLDPLTERVFLIFLNGLPRDFLQQNSTPFLSEIIQKKGAFGVAFTGYLETNYHGMWTVLSGRYSPPFPYSLFTRCQESILDYVGFKCGIGDIPEAMQLMCNFPDKEPFKNINKITQLFTVRKNKASLFIISLNLDPIWKEEYQDRLRQIDDDIRFMTATIQSFPRSNRSTFIVTSARGSPLGNSLTIDAPVIAWGKGIVHTEEVMYMWKSDLTAMLCVLLGINYPTRLFGIPPIGMMELQEYYDFAINLYTIQHFERVLEIAKPESHLVESSELQLHQMYTRLEHIILSLKNAKLHELFVNSCWLILLFVLLGVNSGLYLSSGIVRFSFNLQAIFFMLLVMGTTFMLSPISPEFPILIELVLFWTWQNRNLFCDCICNNYSIIIAAIVLAFVAVTFVGIFGNIIALPVFFAPVALWSIIDGSCWRLNRFVLLIRFLSSVALGILPYHWVFGVAPDRFTIAFASSVFLVNFFILFIVFRREIDEYIKINAFVIFATITLIFYPSLRKLVWLRIPIPCLVIVFFIFSFFSVSGTLMSKLLKTFLSLLIPVILLSVKNEVVCYLSLIFNLFTWLFVEYHRIYPTNFHFNPPIFSVEPVWSLKPVQFSFEDLRHIIFFVVYCYFSYFAFGSLPDLHSYDLYVLPTFVYWYPRFISYFLAILRFVLPFFIPTLSFIALCLLKEKNFNPLITASIWFSDIIGCFLIFYSQFFNNIFERAVFPSKFSYFIIQQVAVVSVIFSYFLGKRLLLGSKNHY